MAPRTTPKKAKQAKQAVGLRITVDGTPYDVVMSELTANDVKAYRHATGSTVNAAVNRPDELDIDTLAGLVWIVRRRSEPTLTYDAVADAWNYATKFELSYAYEGEQAGDAGEA